MSSRASPVLPTKAMGRGPAELLRGLVRLLYGRRPGPILLPVTILWLLHLSLQALSLWLEPVTNPGSLIQVALARMLFYLLLVAAWWQVVKSARLGGKLYRTLPAALVLAEGLLLFRTAAAVAGKCEVYVPLIEQLVKMIKNHAGQLL